MISSSQVRKKFVIIQDYDMIEINVEEEIDFSVRNYMIEL